jgi:hypothetical protein
MPGRETTDRFVQRVVEGAHADARQSCAQVDADSKKDLVAQPH